MQRKNIKDLNVNDLLILTDFYKEAEDNLRNATKQLQKSEENLAKSLGLSMEIRQKLINDFEKVSISINNINKSLNEIKKYITYYNDYEKEINKIFVEFNKTLQTELENINKNSLNNIEIIETEIKDKLTTTKNSIFGILEEIKDKNNNYFKNYFYIIVFFITFFLFTTVFNVYISITTYSYFKEIREIIQIGGTK